MPISVQRILTLPMSTSKLAFNSYRMASHPQQLQMALPPYPGTSIPKHTSLRQSMGQPLHNGAHHSLSSLHRVLLHQPWVALDGIDRSLKSAILDYPLSS
jgi:hypothetical protein